MSMNFVGCIVNTADVENHVHGSTLGDLEWNDEILPPRLQFHGSFFKSRTSNACPGLRTVKNELLMLMYDKKHTRDHFVGGKLGVYENSAATWNFFLLFLLLLFVNTIRSVLMCFMNPLRNINRKCNCIHEQEDESRVWLNVNECCVLMTLKNISPALNRKAYNVILIHREGSWTSKKRCAFFPDA